MQDMCAIDSRLLVRAMLFAIGVLVERRSAVTLIWGVVIGLKGCEVLILLAVDVLWVVLVVPVIMGGAHRLVAAQAVCLGGCIPERLAVHHIAHNYGWLDVLLAPLLLFGLLRRAGWGTVSLHGLLLGYSLSCDEVVVPSQWRLG